MFVLVYSEGNSLSTDNECRAYDSAEKAHAVMLGQLERILADDDYSISRKVECAPGRYDLYGDWAGEGGGKVYLGFLHDFDAYLEDGEHRWVIHEVPDSPTERKPYIAHIMVPLSIYFRAKSEKEANYLAETIVADTDRLHELLGKVFADSGSNAFLSDVVCDSDEDGYADITLDASEVEEIISEQDDYK